MAKMRLKNKKAEKVQTKRVIGKSIKWDHGDVADIPIGRLEANPWNPNEMSPDEFDMLSENVEDVGFLDYPLVVPIEEGKFRIIDGEHRYEQQRLLDAESVRCIVAAPDRMDEIEQMRQTVRMNKIRGKISPRKFTSFVEKYMEKSQVEPEELPHDLGFVDMDEFEELIDQARESLPSDDMKKDFDAAREELKTIDDLSLLLNRLFTKYGDTLPFHFMFLDFGGKNCIWVRMDPKGYKLVQSQAREVQSHGFTFDSVVARMILLMDVDEFVDQHKDFLEEVEVPTTGEVDAIDDLMD